MEQFRDGRKSFLNLIRTHTPDLFRIFAASSDSFWTKKEKTVVRSIYSWINEVNFSSQILEKSADELYVLRAADVKWSDLGEPQRVIGTLENLGVYTAWMRVAAT